ncbi:MAG TPA: tetratricopeptide repeat protein [Puia sp.]|nr:tetratricopeptide repeat protein [Puia sp.]
MQILKRSLLIVLLVRATAVAQPADSLARQLQIHPARDSNRITTLLRLSDAIVYTDPGTAMRYADEALEIADSLPWTKGIALAQRQKGNVYYVFSDNTAAMDWYLKALRESRTLNNRELDASLFNNLANIYSDLKQYEKALDYYRQFLATAREAGSAKEEVIALVNLATVYSELNAQDTALSCNREALDIARRGGINYFIPIVLNNMGIFYSKKGPIDSALAYFRQCMTLADREGNYDAKASALNETGKLFLDQGEYANAEKYSLESLAMARRLHSVEWQANAWENLYRVAEKTGRYAKALDAYKQFILFRDSVSNAEKKDALTKKELQFDFQRKEAALKAEQDKKEALAKSEIAKQSLIKRGVLAGSLLLMLVGCYGFLLYKRRRDAEEKRREADLKAKVADTEMKVLRLQLNPHFIFNSLNSISDYISQHQPDKANYYLIKFAKMIRQVLENSERPEIPIAEDLKVLETYIQLEALRLTNELCYEISVDQEIDAETTLVPPLIVQPFVENSIWHGLSGPEGVGDGKGRISIRIRKEDGMINYIVEDNGIGREQAAGKRSVGRRSMGLGITRERIDIINRMKRTQASVEIFDLPKGTRVELRLPLELKY